ncbi:hypothetical protein Poli38472_014137 [Pythium oligandrum]|uniref:AFG1-like ATPase n=1 Tax=Pythium oligandrum TaxID=41045 RepID=A0A8K1FHL3_PYTOL|nr:hypothetical protein Poli38472_014137 [Pythium oligandrum]|eukprot:TMW64020.1 hypothetical protein Poli38472_014137 [Pythium oligandrum]
MGLSTTAEANQTTPSYAQAPSATYTALVESGALQADDAQWRVVKRFLDKLHRQVRDYRLPAVQQASSRSAEPAETENEKPVPVMVPRGLYIHGHVGTGKSMLMDLFFSHVPLPHKRRVHFNKFMLEIHQRLQFVKQEQLRLYGRQRNITLDQSRDAISIVAEQLVQESHLLCFDEFQVTDIADAMIMRKLFGVFYSRGGVMVATSNTPPQELYKDGTNREYFLPFLQQLSRHTKVVNMDSVVDYRVLAQPLAQQTFFYPLTPETSDAVNELFDEVADDVVEPLRIPVMMGRWLTVLGTRDGVARVSFEELCMTEKGAADYKALSECFHTVVLEGVPQLEMKAHDQARRLILLIDELYEHRTRLICSAAVPPSQLFHFDEAPLANQAEALAASEQAKKHQLEESVKQRIPPASSWDAPVGAYNPAKMAGLQVQNLCSLQDLKIAFKRAVSRLAEMQSDKYLEQNKQLRQSRQQHLLRVLAN